jgi:hypothetical protein
VRVFGGELALGIPLLAANIFPNAAHVIVKSLRIVCAVAVNFLNNRVFHIRN